MQGPTFLGKFILVSICFRMELIQTRVYKVFLTLTYPPKHHYLSRITILIPTSKFFNTIVDVDYLIHAIDLYTKPTLEIGTHYSELLHYYAT